MLQISTGMYFDGEEAWETRHRQVFYTNLIRLSAQDVDLPVGTLQFVSTGDAIAITAVDRLPKKNPDGSEAFHVATSGEALLGDVADVVAFALDALVLDNHDLARQLVRTGQNEVPLQGPRLRRTLKPQRFVTDEELADLKVFFAALLALQRPHFEQAMRAIRRVVDAVALADTDVTLAYSLYVAALESLSAGTDVPTPLWENYDRKRQKIVDTAVAGLTEERIEQIRNAVLSIDQLSLRRRFQAFVIEHTEPSFYRAEALEAVKPIRAADLPRALDFAYQTRSTSLHEMRDLVPELWLVSGTDDTTRIDGRWMLTIEGLNRLSRHVIRRFVERSPTGTDDGFDWQRVLPGVVRVELDPTMWLHMHDGFAASEGPSLFGSVMTMLCAALGDHGQVANMQLPLIRVEQLLAEQAKSEARVPLIATYLLWHRTTPAEMHRPHAEKVIGKYVDDLNSPSIPALALGILLGIELPWTTEQLSDLIEARTADLSRRRVKLELPYAMDAAFQLTLATSLWKNLDTVGALRAVSAAVELDPGNESLIAIETTMQGGDLPSINLARYVTTGSLNHGDTPAESSDDETDAANPTDDEPQRP